LGNWVCSAGAPEVIEYLYSRGVRLDAKNSMGETPLDLADHQESTTKPGILMAPRTSLLAS
jgi:ankyrin repeat protein